MGEAAVGEDVVGEAVVGTAGAAVGWDLGVGGGAGFAVAPSVLGEAVVGEGVGAEVGLTVVGKEVVGEPVVGDAVDGAMVGAAAVGVDVGISVGEAVVGAAVGAPVLTTVTAATPVALIVPNEVNSVDAANTLPGELSRAVANAADAPAGTVSESKVTDDTTRTLPAEMESITTALVSTPAADATVDTKSARKIASKAAALKELMSNSENNTVKETIS